MTEADRLRFFKKTALINEIERLRGQLVESEAKIIELQKENNWLQAKLASTAAPARP